MKRKFFGIFATLCIVLCMCFTLAPATVFAEESFPSNQSAAPRGRNDYLFTLEVFKEIVQDPSADYTFIDPAIVLSNIEFTLYATEDIIDPSDGSVVTRRGEVANLYNPDTNKFSTQGIFSPDSAGYFKTSNLLLGKYKLTETNVPAGIVLPSSTFAVTHNDQGTTQTLQLKNETIKTKFSCTDASQTNDLSGFTITLFKKDGSQVQATDGSPLSWTSADRAYFVEGLPVGEYLLHEISAADGYVLKTSDVPFTVKNVGDIQTFTINNKKVILDKAPVGGKKITGATISVVDKNTGNVVDTWTDDGTSHVVKNLEEGNTYTVCETAPENSPVTFQNLDFTVDSDFSKDQNILWNTYICTHTGGTATTTEKAICEVCGEEYGDLAVEPEHPHTPQAPNTPQTQTEKNAVPKTGDAFPVEGTLITFLLSTMFILVSMKKNVKLHIK